MTRSDPPSRRALSVVCCALGLLATATPARADDPRDDAGARVLFGEGRTLADAGRYAEACRKFEESLRLAPGVGTSFNLADCQEHLGLTATAWARFMDVAAATRLAGQVERERVARSRAAALEPRLARLVVEVTGPVDGQTVLRDGLPLGVPAWGAAVPVDPGPHVVEARAPGRVSWTQTATVPDAATTVVVAVPALAALAPPEAPTPPPAVARPSATVEATAPPPRRWSAPVLAFGAVAAAALATSAVAAMSLGSANDEAKGLCPLNVCDTGEEKARHDALVADARRDRLLVYTTAGIGTAALVAAIYFWWRPVRPVRPATSDPSTPRSRMTARLGGGVLAAGLEIVW